MTATVTMIDTSVLCELLQVPGKSTPERGADVLAEVDLRWQLGERFVIPLTAVIETGNHIAQASEYRYDAAGRFVRLLRDALSEESHWRVLQTPIGAEFVASLCAGNSTGQSLEELARSGMGAGDVAILVERDQLLAATAIRNVRIWTFDRALEAHASNRP